MELQPLPKYPGVFHVNVGGAYVFGEQTQKNEAECVALQDILHHERIKTVFQPIFDLQTGEVYAYECLTRITGKSRFSGPEPLFEAADRCCLIEELENFP